MTPVAAPLTAALGRIEVEEPTGHSMMVGLRPEPQRLYVDANDGTVGKFDSRAGSRMGFYQLSTRAFIKLPIARMRSATSSEARAFERAKKAKVECVVRGR